MVRAARKKRRRIVVWESMWDVRARAAPAMRPKIALRTEMALGVIPREASLFARAIKICFERDLRGRRLGSELGESSMAALYPG